LEHREDLHARRQPGEEGVEMGQRLIGRHAGVFDAVLSADFYEPLPGAGAMTEALGEVLSGAEDYEGVLDRARIWAKERRFRIGVHLLRGLSTCAEAGRAHADLAEACLRALLPHVEAEVARRHGGAPGRGAAVIALGKFGSREMTATSDLDLIVIYEAEGAPASDGARPLAAPAWYARLAKTLVSAMTAPTAEGTLYEVDMRLRPSGRQGPVAVPLSGFRTYQAEEAWTWEHLALTRARVVAGPAALAADVEAAIAEVRALPRAAAKVRQDVAEMRQRLAEAHGRLPVWEMKRGPGRMQDIELLVQAEALIAGLPGARPISRTLAALSSGGHLERDAARTLAAAHGLFLSVQQVQRVAVEGEATPEAAGRGLATILARVASAEDIDALEVKVGEAARAAEAVIAGALPAEGGA
ncbi:MAG: glutamine-synthetase adenylyltransferase, partial [Pseudomonadota bacterium]